ncbi:MAG: hypothetical protein AAB443_00775 [Patescibacteria group bacterium]
MLPAVKKLYDYFEGFRGKKLVVLVACVFTLFALLGLILGQLPNFLKNTKGAKKEDSSENVTLQDPAQKLGKVVYVNPDTYPDENISYKLVDAQGKDIILLKADDDKLKFVEGATVKLKGKVERTNDGKKEVFFVEQVVYN